MGYLKGKFSKIANKLPHLGKVPSLTNRLWRLLDNERIKVQDWYSPLAKQIAAGFKKALRVFVLVDTTKVGFNHRALVIGATFRLAWIGLNAVCALTNLFIYGFPSFSKSDV